MTLTLRVPTGIAAGTVLALHLGLAAAHSAAPFDDAYWKRPVDRAHVQQTAAAAPVARALDRSAPVERVAP